MRPDAILRGGGEHAAPPTLTASDGTGLALQQLTARAVLEGPLAFTEVHFSFFNAQPRVLEGTFKISLPQGASVSRFAMRVGDQWQEGEIVERQSARSPSYTLQVHYYSRGPMGYGMGKVEIIDHDGHGGLTFSERPFVVMNDQAFVELGKY